MALILLHDAVALCTALFKGWSIPCKLLPLKANPNLKPDRTILPFFNLDARGVFVTSRPCSLPCKGLFWPEVIDVLFACRKTVQVKLSFQRIHLKAMEQRWTKRKLDGTWVYRKLQRPALHRNQEMIQTHHQSLDVASSFLIVLVCW